MSDFDALSPTPEEIEALTTPLRPEAIRLARDWSTPAPGEIARLRLARPRPQRSRAWLAPALAAAVVLLLQLQPTPPAAHLSPPIPPIVEVVYATPVVPLDVAHPLTTPLTLGPSISVEGSGEIRLLTADADGTALEVLSGAATFEVDPGGMFRDLAVHAGDVTVYVTGTRFTVETDPIAVSVSRGSVRIEHADDSLALTAADGRWTLPSATQTVTLPPILREIPIPSTLNKVTPDAEDATLAVALAWAEILNAREDGIDTIDLLRRVEGFISDNPGHPLADEASFKRLGLLQDMSAPEELLGEVDAWLTAWPGSSRRAEVLMLRATLSRQTGDCVMASAYYRAVLTEPDPLSNDEARRWLDWCAAQ